MHTKSLVKRLLKIDKIVIEDVKFELMDEEEIFVVQARPMIRDTYRCPMCGRRCPGYDSSRKIRRWRSLDFGNQRVYIEAFAPRVKCPEHGVVVAKFPWSRHDSDYTYDFETAVTWFTLHATAQDVAEYFRIDWHTVGSIARRVQESIEKEQPSRFDNLEEIGIDETSYKKGHKYMTVIINHRTGHLIWAKKGHGKEVLSEFFKRLTTEQRTKIKYVTADGARWIADCISDYCPNAERCIDPFHVVAWANDRLDEVRKATVKQAKKDASMGKKAERSKKKKIPKSRNMPY
ncbi:MAG: transposase [Sporomusa sp.]